MNRRRTTAFALLATAVMLAVPLGAATFVPEAEESEGAAGFVAGFILGAFIFGTVGYFAGQANEPDGAEDISRAGEANALATGLAYAEAPIENAYRTYEVVWDLTADHWVRQAELCTAAEWSKDTGWSDTVADTVLTDSSIYLNETTMLANAAAQWNSVMDTASKRVASWGDADAYADGKLKLVLKAGSSELTADSGDLPTFYIGSAVRNVQSGADRVYYAGGPIYASSACTMVGSNGYGIKLNAGWNVDNVPAMGSFDKPGIYTLPSGNDYCGYFQSTVHNGAPLVAGMAATAGNEKLFLTWNGSNLMTGSGSSVSSLTLTVVPDGGDGPASLDIKGILEGYQSLISSIDTVQSKARQAAEVNWGIFDDFQESSPYITSLTVPTTQMGNVEWTDDQLKMIRYMAMEQAAEYYQDNKGSVPDTYSLSKDSMTLYCRGSIDLKNSQNATFCDSMKKTDGSADLEGVAFTPIVFKDTELKKGSNQIDGYCYIVVWGECSNLSAFQVATYEDATIIYADGAVLNIMEMQYGEESRNNFTLKVNEIDWIPPKEIDDPGKLEPVESNDADELIRLIFIVIGGALMMVGLGRGNVFAFVIGAVLAVAGVFLAGAIEDLLEGWPFHWRFNWP